MKDILEKAVRWNVPKQVEGIKEYKCPDETTECKDHPAVRPTSHNEIHQMLKTDGCSKNNPWWIWNVLGVIDMDNGHLVVCPGDWILTISEGHYVVLSDETYKALCAQQQSEEREYDRPDR